MEIKLAELKSGQDGNSVAIHSVPFTVGRCRSANLIIAHVTVSRNHCQIIMDDKLWKVNDFSSSGTFVNDILVGKGHSKALIHGDVIRFGPTESNHSWVFCTFYNADQQVANSPVRISVKDKLCNNLVHSELKNKEKECVRQFRDNSELKENVVENINKSERIKEPLKALEQAQNGLNNPEEKNRVPQSDSTGKVNKNGLNLIQNLTEVMENELQCTICSELFVTAVTLSCTHTFCKYCINQWKKKQKTCPICRKRISSETRSLVVDNYIDKMVGNLSVELKERREAIIKERIEEVPVKKRKSRK